MQITKEWLKQLSESEDIVEQLNELLIKFQEEIIEKALLMLPNVMADMMMQHEGLRKLNQDFYKGNEDFKKHTNIVASVIEEIDMKNPGLDYKDILERARPIIKERIQLTSTLDVGNKRMPTPKELDIHGVI